MKKEELTKKIELGRKRNKLNELSSLVNNLRSDNNSLLSFYPFNDNIRNYVFKLKTKCYAAGDELKSINEECQKNCDHEVRLYYKEGLGTGYSTCIFCGKKINFDNCLNGNTVYNSKNRNRNCIMVPASYVDEEDFAHKNYSEEDLYRYLEEIIRRSKKDDIDVIKELDKLELDDAFVNTDAPVEERYVLIVGGVNSYDVGNGYRIIGESNNISLKYLDYFKGIYNTYVELIDNPLVTKCAGKDMNTFIVSYENINELQENLKKEKDVPFNLIIDLTNLVNFDVVNNQVVTTPKSLNWEELFPGVEVINPSLEKYNEKESKEVKKLLFKK